MTARKTAMMTNLVSKCVLPEIIKFRKYDFSTSIDIVNNKY